MADRNEMIIRVFGSASTNATYTAQLDPVTGESSCTCPGWKFKRPNGERSCKHTKQLHSMAPTATSGRATFIELGDPEPAAGASPIKPMLASAMTRGAFEDYCTREWLLEEKFDGHRVIIRRCLGVTEAWSRPRAGKDALRRDLPAHLHAAFELMPDGIYDGELMAPGGRAWDVARLDTRATQILVLFDVCELLGKSVAREPYTKRRELLSIAVLHYASAMQEQRSAERYIVMPAALPVSLDAVQAIWNAGGEGAIVKRASAPYQAGKRSADWVKVKRAGSATLTITGFEKGKTGPYAVVQLRGDDGTETTVKTKDNATMAAIAKNPKAFIGRRLVIAYCERTPDGKFRHGVWDHFAGAGE